MAVADTSFLVDILRDEPKARAMLARLHKGRQDLFAPAPVIQELYYGLAKTGFRRAAREAVEALLGGVPVLPMTASIARTAGLLEAQLESAGKKAGRIDLQIAATALAHGQSLVTRDQRIQIEGLDRLEY